MIQPGNSSQLPFCIVDLGRKPKGCLFYNVLRRNGINSQKYKDHERWGISHSHSSVLEGSAGSQSISIPPAGTRQECNLIETVSKSQSPVTCHFLDGFIIAFHVWKKPGSSFARLKGLWVFPADGNTVLCKCWQQREISFQLIIRSTNERSYVCSVVAVCLNTSSNRLLEILALAPGWLKLRFRGLWGAEHHLCPMQRFPGESVLKPGLDFAFWKLNSNPLSVENVLNTEPFNKT